MQCIIKNAFVTFFILQRIYLLYPVRNLFVVTLQAGLCMTRLHKISDSHKLVNILFVCCQ
jgi:hypothetical protein